jgi:hypothetical protein
VLRSRFNPFGESLNRFDHILNDLLRITKDHHGFIHVEKFVLIDKGFQGYSKNLVNSAVIPAC